MVSFKHSGDLGDLIYALPTIRYLAGTDKALIYLADSDRTRVKMSTQAGFILPLLMEQSYIGGVELYAGQSVAYDLDSFRRYWSENAEFGVTIAEWHARAFDVPRAVIDEQWLNVDFAPVRSVIIHRSGRYHNGDFDWNRVVKTYGADLTFIGLRSEWDNFCDLFGLVKFHPVMDALEMAQIIRNSKLFIGNQSLPNAIAEGLKVRKITETFMTDPNCVFERADAQHVFTRNIYLPEV